MSMSRTYVFPDLHGRLDHFVNAMNAAFNDGADKDSTMVFLGDYIDRGPESAQLVAALRDLVTYRPKTIALSGNHEYMMIWGLSEGDQQLQGWMVNGGITTVESYTNGLGEMDKQAMERDAIWFVGLPMYHQDEHRVYVHAGLISHLPVEAQPMEALHWHRYSRTHDHGHFGKHIVHGHTPDKKGPVTTGDRTALDVGAYKTGRYVVAVFEDDTAGGPVRVLEVHGQD
jgi:serine/threonine protein phosphatase 1